MLAYDYPLMNVFLSILYFSLFFMWIWIAVTVVVDIFRSDDLGGVAKGFWFLFVVLAPFLGIFIYLIARGGKMQDHAVADAKAMDAAQRAYIQQAAGTGTSDADQLDKLAGLHSAGKIDDAEYAAAKAKVLGT